MKKELVTHLVPKSPVSETFRTLRTNIQFMNSNIKLRTLLVTSTVPGEGKSWVTANLAVTFAQAGKRVVLIDADMRKGRLYTIFKVQPRPGLSNYLSKYSDESNHLDLNDYVVPTEVENLYIMPAGNVPPNPSELLVTRQMRNLLDELIDFSVNEFIIEKEYLEFVSLLRLYVNTQNSLTSTIHIISSDIGLIILDKDLNSIKEKNIKENRRDKND